MVVLMKLVEFAGRCLFRPRVNRYNTVINRYISSIVGLSNFYQAVKICIEAEAVILIDRNLVALLSLS